jgi:hypothetical protein
LWVDKIGEGICSNYRLHELTFWCTLSKLEWALESTEQVFFFLWPMALDLKDCLLLWWGTYAMQLLVSINLSARFLWLVWVLVG